MNGYIQVKFGGKERGFKFNQAAVQEFWRRIDLFHSTEAGEVYAYFYAGLLGNCIVKGTEIDFTFEEVTEWVDDLYLTDEGKLILNQVSKAFTETDNYKVALANMQQKIRTIIEEKGATSDSTEDKKKGKKKLSTTSSP